MKYIYKAKEGCILYKITIMLTQTTIIAFSIIMIFLLLLFLGKKLILTKGTTCAKNNDILHRSYRLSIFLRFCAYCLDLKSLCAMWPMQLHEWQDKTTNSYVLGSENVGLFCLSYLIISVAKQIVKLWVSLARVSIPYAYGSH